MADQSVSVAESLYRAHAPACLGYARKIWGQMPLAEIAAIANVPLQTVASRFRYGLAKLRELMESKRED